MSYRLKALIINTGNQLAELNSEHPEEVLEFFKSMVEEYAEDMADALESKGFIVEVKE